MIGELVLGTYSTVGLTGFEMAMSVLELDRLGV